jgi:hydrogenase-1 operon protein HyaE
MTHPLIDRLDRELGFPQAATAPRATHIVAAPGPHVLFVPGDPARNLETADVAVILPECAGVPGRLRLRRGRRRDRGRHARDGGRLQDPVADLLPRRAFQIGALPKVRDWSDYMARIAQILTARTETEALDA